jgi:hypothetical protein
MLHRRTQASLLHFCAEDADAICVMASHPCPSTAAGSLKVARRTCRSYKQLHYPHSAGQSLGGTKATTQGQEQPTTLHTDGAHLGHRYCRAMPHVQLHTLTTS